ncbi:MAG: polyketide cyclase [Rhodoglobus sp.]|nr:polyketide cyclase [Rhodoglobus sp.]
MLSADDIVEIEKVIAEYGHVVDNNRWERAHLVFARDFVYDFSRFGRPNIQGVAELRKALKTRKIYSHHSTNISVAETSDGHARAHSKYIGFPSEGFPISGDYEDDFVRTEAGWRLLRRRSSVREPSF